jgi:predicted RNase H-like HicB family nuclease
MTTMKYKAVIQESPETGLYVASVPELPGLYAEGETLDEVTENLKLAIKARIEQGGEQANE